MTPPPAASRGGGATWTLALAGRGGRRWSSLRCAECVVRWGGGAAGRRRGPACARGGRAAWGGWPARCARTPLALSLPRCVLQAGRRVERVEVNYSRAAKQARAVCCCVCEVEHQRCMHACTRARAACVPPPKPPHAHPHARARALAAFVPLPTPSLSLITATLLQVDVRLLKELMWEGVQASDPGGAPPSPDSVRQFQVGGWACGGGGRVGVCVWGGGGGRGQPARFSPQPTHALKLTNTCVHPPSRSPAGSAAHRARAQPRRAAGGPVRCVCVGGEGGGAPLRASDAPSSNTQSTAPAHPPPYSQCTSASSACCTWPTSMGWW